ncbi:hypothetical protein [uncultured Methanomethylovorans sp.]|uniref:COG1470 family protein n=1 Tax=uncultured Methanomethylovorans sp. TaxID=183759 RepID=UPI002AA695F7|nr:hypothetical protein [uncultured Methanomethylovorans sp.]
MKRGQIIIYGVVAVLFLCIAGATAMAGDLLEVDSISVSTVGSGISNAEMTDRLVPDPYYGSMMIKEGEVDSFEFVLNNQGETTTNVNFSVYNPGYSQYPIDPSWITITPSSASIEAGKSINVKVDVAIPEGTKVATYDCMLNISDAQGIASAVAVMVDVYADTNIQFAPYSIYDWVEAGKEYNYEITINNTGTKEVSIDPKLNSEIGYSYPGAVSAFGNDDIEITSPSSVLPGESAIVKLKLTVPEGSKGEFYGSVDLNINDSSIYEDSEQVSINFHVPVAPSKPYQIPFKVKENGTATIELKSTRPQFYSMKSYDDPSFTVKIYDPQGKEVSPTLMSNMYGGSVSLASNPYLVIANLASSISGYQDNVQQYVDTYDVNVTPGTWTLSVLPSATESFDYSIEIKPTQ